MTSANSGKYSFFFEGTNGAGVLLIHGITGTPSEMRHLGRRLNKAGFSVLCNTLPRHCSTLAELKKVTWQEIYAACKDDFLNLTGQCQKVYAGGISMGALLAIHLAAELPAQMAGIIALAPTFDYDGWAVHKGKALMTLAWHIPFVRNSVNIRESWPYGIKDEATRNNFARFYKRASASKFYKEVLLFGSPFFPLCNLYQHHLFAKVVMREIPSVNAPILLVHAAEDDMTSRKNSDYIYGHIGSKDKTLVILKDSYHMITIDKEKEEVAAKVIDFLQEALRKRPV